MSAETITVCARGCDHTSINAAIATASDGDVIQLSAEIYFEGTEIDLLGKSITIQGTTDASGRPTSVLHGQDNHRVVMCRNGEGAETRLVSLELRSGRSTSIDIPDLGTYSDGGGLVLIDSTGIEVRNCVFKANRGSWGGGAYCYRSSAAFLGCSFEQNDAEIGGGMVIHRPGELILEDCTFVGNTATIVAGGLYCRGFSTPTLQGCRFLENIAAISGGGARCFQSNTDFNDCDFEDNRSLENAGGLSAWDCTVDLDECRFKGNQAELAGGDIHLQESSIGYLSGCEISGITAQDDNASITMSSGYLLADRCSFGGQNRFALFHEAGGFSWIADSSFEKCCSIIPPSGFEDLGGITHAGTTELPCLDCRGNLDCRNDAVDADDLGYLLSRWDTADPQCDLDGDGVVQAGDLGLLFAAWGPCD